MHALRAIKHPLEIAAIQQACHITEMAFRRILEFVKPGVWEFEIEAEIVHEFLRNRSHRPAYESIIASGANACVLHYILNNAQCKDGDLLLMDFGAEYANYNADLTRTIPVNGRFTPRQRAVYDAVLRVQKAAIEMLVPGNRIPEYHKEVGKIMESELIGLGLLNKHEVARQDPSFPLYRKYFMHGTSHHLGIDVHDYGNKYRTFEPGMVFTCEPGIYIREEGIGIRIENNLVVTEKEPLDLMASIPREAEEIETLMQAGRLT
jgi:Xaa-Pro aminopeptidase